MYCTIIKDNGSSLLDLISARYFSLVRYFSNITNSKLIEQIQYRTFKIQGKQL